MNLIKKGLAVSTISMLLPLFMGTAQAQTQHSLQAGSGGQLMIGSGLPLPIQVWTKGAATSEAGSYPPLLIDAVPFTNTGQIITQQTNGQITVPPNVLSEVAATILKQPTFATNPAVFQVNTAIDFRFPIAAATFAPGGGPAALGGGTQNFGGPAGGSMTYKNTGNQFGGAARYAVNGNVALSPGGAIPNQPVTVYINNGGMLAASATKAALLGALVANAEAGAPVSDPTATTPGVPAPNATMFGSFTPGGMVLASTQCDNTLPVGPPPACGPPLVNNVIGDKGYPWTTGFITIVAGMAVPPETFFISGTDTRPGGVGSGNITLVTGSLSDRSISGPNANRGWVSLTLPEPTAMAGAAGALLMLGVCHNMVRRRR